MEALDFGLLSAEGRRERVGILELAVLLIRANHFFCVLLLGFSVPGAIIDLRLALNARLLFFMAFWDPFEVVKGLDLLLVLFLDFVLVEGLQK